MKWFGGPNRMDLSFRFSVQPGVTLTMWKHFIWLFPILEAWVIRPVELECKTSYDCDLNFVCTYANNGLTDSGRLCTYGCDKIHTCALQGKTGRYCDLEFNACVWPD